MGREKTPSTSDATDGGGASRPWRAAGIRSHSGIIYGLDWMDRVCLPFCFSTPFESSQLVKLDNKCGLSCEELHSCLFGYGVDSGSTVGSALHMR